MSKDDTAALTKADGKMILEIMNQILGRLDAHSKRFDAMDQRFDAMDQRFDDAHTGTALLIENLRADVLDAKKDQVEQHQDRLADHDRRIATLERRVAV